VPPPDLKVEPPPEPEPAPPAEPKIQALVPQDEKNRLAREIAARRSEIDRILEQLPPSEAPERNAAIERVRSFLALSAQYAERGDLRQADALSTRALVLAKELAGER
jgi:hypothetical protein